MTFRRRGSVVVSIVAGIAVILIAVLRSAPTPTGSASFLGWTNIKGQVHASLLFEPVTDSRPHKNWFMFQFYRVGLDFSYIDENGGSNSLAFRENVHFYPHHPGVFQFPVPTNATTLQFYGADTWLERRWDNIDLPFRLPSRHFRFTPPVIASEHREQLRSFQE